MILTNVHSNWFFWMCERSEFFICKLRCNIKSCRQLNYQSPLTHAIYIILPSPILPVALTSVEWIR